MPPFLRHLRGSTALTAVVALVGTLLLATPAVAADPTLEASGFSVTSGATAVSPQPTADPTYLSDLSYNASPAAGTVSSSLTYRCASDTEDCVDATVTVSLDQLTLSAPVVVDGLDVPPTVDYWADTDAVVPASGYATAVVFTVDFGSALGDGDTGLAAGVIGTLKFDSTLITPSGGGSQQGTAIAVPSAKAGAGLPSRVRVNGEFPVNLATTTALSWARTSFLSGVDDGVESPTNTATVTGTVTGDPADSLTLTWGGANPAQRPGAGTAGMLLDLTTLRLTGWPTGAASATVTGWRWTGASSAPAQVDLGTVTGTGTDLLSGLTSQVRSALTGLRVVFVAADGSRIATGAVATAEIGVREHLSTNSTPVARNNAAVDYVTNASGGSFDASSDLNTLTITGAATTVAARGSANASSSDSKGFRVYDPRPYAGSSTALRGLNAGTVYGGGYVVATSGGTNWSRRAVEQLTVTVPSTSAQVTSTNALLDPDLPAVDSRTFGPGLTFAGFGAGRSGSAADGTGLTVTGLTGPADLVLTVQTSGGAGGSVTLDATNPVAPTAPSAFGLTSWSQVTGYSAVLRGNGSVVPMGASMSIPVLLRAATAASAQTYAAHTTAQSALGSATSAVTPRTAQSGNRPVTAAQIAVEVPDVAVNGTKTVVEPYVATTDGTATAVLEAVSRAGASRHLPDTLIVEDSARLNSNAGAPWWNVFQPLSVQAPAGTVVEYYTNTSGAPVWTEYTGSLSALAGADTWRGMRVVSHAAADSTFPDGTIFRSLVVFGVRDAVLNGQIWTSGTVLTNVAEAQSAATIEGNLVSSPVTRVTDTVTGIVPDGDGHHALVKVLSSKSGVEGTAAATTATLTWGTDGELHSTVSVADGNGLTAGNSTPHRGSSQSFWDSFNLTRVLPITSGPSAEPGSAYDPYLVFDQVTDVRVFDTVLGEWRSLKDQQWNGTAWVARTAARSDVTFGGSSAVGAFPYVGAFPGVTISSGLQARVGGIDLTYAPRSTAERQTAVGASDWRTALVADLTGAGADAVAATDGPARQVQVSFTLRDLSRASNDPINNAFVTTTGTAGQIANSGRVTGSGGDLGGPVNGSGDWTFRVQAASVGVTATKTWLRTSNGDPLKPSTDLDQLALPVEGPGAPAEAWPSASLQVSGRNTATTRVDVLRVTEPRGIDSATTLSADSPFAQFALTKIGPLTATPSGATGLGVVLYRVNGSGQITADSPITATAATALSATQLENVVGIQLRYTGRIAINATASLELTTRLLAENRITGADTPAGLEITNQVETTVWDARVCDPETGTPSTCSPKVVTANASATVTILDPEVLAVPALEIPTVDLQRDAVAPTVTAVLSGQNFGRTEADALLVTDADPRFFNAVHTQRLTVDRLPTGAEQARLEVLFAGDGLGIDADGAYDGDQVWHEWATGVAGTVWDLDTLAAANGATSSEVIGVRIRFVSTDAQRITAPGQGYGEVTLTGVLREELLTGGLPSAVGAEGWRYQGQAELTVNPGESERGVISNRISALAIRDGLASSPSDSAELGITVHAGAATVRVQKAELNAAARKPGDAVQYRITVTNTATGTGAADLTGLVVTDNLPEDGSLVFGTPPEGEQPWAVTGLGTPAVTSDETTVTFTFGADERLAPGASAQITLWVRVAQDLSSLSIVNSAAATSVSRPVVATSTGADGGTVCTPGSYDSAAAGCVVSSGALLIGGANVYVSEEWVRDNASSSGAVRTTAARPGTSGVCAPRGTGTDANWYRYPCSVSSTAGSVTDWQIQVTSRASITTDRLELVDMLPAVGDYPAMAGSGSRGSQWRPVWDGNLPALVAAAGLPAGATLQVYTTTADYKAGGLSASNSFDPVPGTWSSTPLTGSVPAGQAARVTGFKFVVTFASSDTLSSGESVRVGWSMRTPLVGATQATDTWNSFAFRVPANSSAGRPADVTSVPLKAGARFAVAAVGAETFAVGDRVWLDLDRDGVQDDGEPGVAGAAIDLLSGTDGDAVWAAEAVTDADGNWLIDGLPGGNYQVRVTLPEALAAQYRFTGVGQGLDEVDSDAVPDGDGSSALIASVVLDASAPMVSTGTAQWRAAHPEVTATLVDLSRDAGLQYRPLAVGDRVWFDTDRNGIQDAGEDGVEGATVRLLAANDAVLATTSTDARGGYRFTALDPGDYRIEVELPSALAERWTFTSTGVGDRAADSDATAITSSRGRTGVFTLTPGTPLVSVSSLSVDPTWSGVSDADYAEPTVDVGLAERGVRVGDRVWSDLNGNGIQDSGEPGLPGVELTLTDLAGDPVTDADGQPVDPATTDADGGYSFGNLLPGQYRVSVDDSSLHGYLPTLTGRGTADTDSSTGSATSVVLVGGQSDLSLDFGFRPLWAIGDRVWLDADRDGVQDPGEQSFAGVRVRVLDVDGTEVASVLTDADGRWHADLLEPGDYTIEFTLSPTDAARYTWTVTGDGSRVDADSDAVADGTIPGLARATVTVGDQATGLRAAEASDGVVAVWIDSTWDAGLVEIPVAVGHRVWFDQNRNGVQDAGEPGIAGAVLVLRTIDGREVVDASGQPVGPITTDAGGDYRFVNLLPGSYLVQVDRIASGAALAGYAPTTAGAGSDRELDSSTGEAASRTLLGGEQDTSLDFGWVLADDVQLALRKTVDSRTTDQIVWELTVSAVGTQDAYAGLTVRDALPAGLTFVSGSGGGFTCAAAGQVVTCDYPGVLAAGESATVRLVTALADPRAQVRNTATVSTGDHEYRFEVGADDDSAWSDPAPLDPTVSPTLATGLLALTGATPAGLIATALASALLGLGLLLRARRQRPTGRHAN